MRILIAILLSILIFGCKSVYVDNDTNSSQWYKPPPNTSWHIQLTGSVDLRYKSKIYIINLKETRQEFVQRIQDLDKKVICYFNTGLFAIDETNSQDNYEIVSKDLDLAVQKGCDGVIDGITFDNFYKYSQNHIIEIDHQHNIEYSKYISEEAHNRGLSVGYMSISQSLKEIESYFDFVVVVECHSENKCNEASSFTASNKAVFNIEFGDTYVRDLETRKKMCIDTVQLNISSLVLPQDLTNQFRYSCIEENPTAKNFIIK